MLALGQCKAAVWDNLWITCVRIVGESAAPGRRPHGSGACPVADEIRAAGHIFLTGADTTCCVCCCTLFVHRAGPGVGYNARCLVCGLRV